MSAAKTRLGNRTPRDTTTAMERLALRGHAVMTQGTAWRTAAAACRLAQARAKLRSTVCIATVFIVFMSFAPLVGSAHFVHDLRLFDRELRPALSTEFGGEARPSSCKCAISRWEQS